MLALPGLLHGGALLAQTQPRSALAARANALGLRLLAAEAGGGGALLSPLSLLDALAPLAPGAQGAAAEALARLLGPRARGEALALHQRLGTDPALRRAAALWLPQRRAPLRGYAAAIAPLGTQVEALDFADPAALVRINGWVAERTTNLIPTLLDRLPRDPGLVLTAALYFAARWAMPFNPADTQAGPFTRGDGRRVQARFLRGTRTIPFTRDTRWQAVRLPYATDAFELLLLGPEPGRPAGQAAQALRERRLTQILSALRFAPAEVELAIPKLTLDHTADLLPELRQGELAPAFSMEADYRGITGAAIRLSALRQRVVLKLDEAGTEAAAATAVLGDRAMVERARFAADRPFLAFVVHRPTGLHVVTALVNQPGDA